MNILEVIGTITVVAGTLIGIWKAYRKMFPRSYSWNTCPNDHDTMARHGFEGVCDKCGNKI